MPNLHVIAGIGETPSYPLVRRIGLADIKAVLVQGFDDFSAMPTHVLFLGILYPVVGLFLFWATVGYDIMPLLFPLASGFALIGPFAAVGLYELSRRREQGLESSWTNAFDVLQSPSRDAILALGFLLMAIFLIWLATAQLLYQSLFGFETPASITQFARDVFTTPAGWTLIVAGNAIGFLFAVLVLIISAVSFPLLLDREVGAAVAMPVLAHATWHLYRRVVEPDLGPRPEHRRPLKAPRYAADFPAALFPSPAIEDQPPGSPVSPSAAPDTSAGQAARSVQESSKATSSSS